MEFLYKTYFLLRNCAKKQLHIRFRYPRRRISRSEKLCRRRFDKTVELLRYNNHIIHTKDTVLSSRAFNALAVTLSSINRTILKTSSEIQRASEALLLKERV